MLILIGWVDPSGVGGVQTFGLETSFIVMEVNPQGRGQALMEVERDRAERVFPSVHRKI